MPVPVLSFDRVMDALLSMRKSYMSKYLAMYSSWYGGIITDPSIMMVPIDDHLVHRGDGVFEVFHCIDWNIYALDMHLERMKRSMEAFYLASPVDREQMIEIICATVRAGNNGNCLVRLFLSRGPGSFSVNPYDTVGSQFYVLAVAMDPVTPTKYENGVRLITSDIPVKYDYFATRKNCNYLPNVLMKKEAVDRGVDFAVSIDESGFLTEGPTENIGIVTKAGEFLVPRFSRTLKGITVSRAIEFAQNLTASELTNAKQSDITRDEAYDAAEILVFGTYFNILPVVDFDGKIIGTGRPGPVFKRLKELLLEDQLKNRDMLTPVRV